MEVAFAVGCIAGKRDLGNLFAEQISNLVVGHIAHLVVVLEHVAHFVATPSLLRFHESIAGLVLGADVAIDAFPALVAFALVAVAYCSMFVPESQGATY